MWEKSDKNIHSHSKNSLKFINRERLFTTQYDRERYNSRAFRWSGVRDEELKSERASTQVWNKERYGVKKWEKKMGEGEEPQASSE